MELTIWVRHILFAVITTGFVSSFACMFMLFISKVFKKINPCLHLYMCKAAVLMAVVPILTPFLYLRKMHYENGVWVFKGNVIGGVSYRMAPIYVILLCIIVIGIVIYFLINYAASMEIRCTLRGNVPVDDKKWTGLAEEYESKYSVNKVEVLQNDLLNTPVTLGIIKNSIVVPYKEYAAKNMHMIFEHEFYHIKHKDLVWKKICYLATYMHVFNLLIHHLFYELVLHQEIVCDLHAANNNSNYTFEEYMLFLGQIDDKKDKEKDKDKSDKDSSTAAAKGKKSFMTKRVESVMFHRYLKKPSKIVTALTLSLMIIFSTVPAYIIASQLSDLENKMIEETADKHQEEYVPFENYLTEYTRYAGDDDVNEIWVETETAQLGRSNILNINITVAPGDRMLYSPIQLTQYAKVTITTAPDNDDVTYRIGLQLNDSQSQYYVEGKGIMVHEFVVPYSGRYSVFVQNMSDSERIHVGGNAMWK